jgi:hypothetical protein
MISLKATGFPEGFEFKDAPQETWSIFYFAPLSEMKTIITVVGLDQKDTEQPQKACVFDNGDQKTTCCNGQFWTGSNTTGVDGLAPILVSHALNRIVPRIE